MKLNKDLKKIKKILLIEPPKTTPAQHMKRVKATAQPPLGLAYLAAVLEQNNYEVKIIDAIIEDPLCSMGTALEGGYIRYGLDDDEVAKRIREYNPDIVGVSCLVSAKYKDAKNVCRIAKAVNPGYITVMGGSHPTINAEDVLKDDNLDFVVLGEGDYSFLELVQYIEGKLGLDGLDGVGMKDNGHIKIIPKTRFIKNVDEIPLPARHLLANERYSQVNLPHGEATRLPWMTIYSSRGCTAACTNCAVYQIWGKKYRPRSAESVLKEIEILIKDYGAKELLIEDDNFSADYKRVSKILDGIINNKWDITWTTPSGIAIYTLDEKLLKKFKDSGCTSLTLGVESGSQRVLSKVLKKPLSLKKAEEVARAVRKVGLKTRAFFMLGIPGETKEEMRQTLEVARKLKLDWSCFNVTQALPGTQLHKICRDNKYIKDNMDPTDVEFTTCRINTEEFDEKFVNDLWDEANNINFLENPNLMEDGNLDQAILDFSKVIRIAPRHELAHLALGNAYAKKGMIEEAIKMWKAVLDINKDNKTAKALLDEANERAA